MWRAVAAGGLAAVVLLTGCAGTAQQAAISPTAPTTSAAADSPSPPPAVSATPTATPTAARTTSPAPAPSPTSTTSTASTTPTDALPADVRALPAGNGASIAVVVDDVGGADTYLGDYLALPVPVAFAVMPLAGNATADDRRIAAAGRAVLLHIPLPIAADLHPAGGLGIDATAAQAAEFVATAKQRVPHAVGANNHQGSLGTSTPALMQVLLPTLQRAGLWFLDSVTSQQTVGYATALSLGMPSRLNNVFLDNEDSDAAARHQLLELARLAAVNGSAIGICHVHRPYQLRALQQVAGALVERGYRFRSVTEVTNRPAGGLDVGVRTSL